MGAYRGLAFIIGSETGYTAFDSAYTFVGSRSWCALPGLVPGRSSLVAVGVGFLMHRTVFGRRCFAVGNNKDAAWIAGIDVARLKIQAYALAGGLAGIASLVWIGQYGSARGDNADGSILFVVTAVVLGGIDINGGRGYDPRRRPRPVPARHAAQRHGPRQRRRADPDRRPRCAPHPRRAPPAGVRAIQPTRAAAGCSAVNRAPN